MCRKWVEIKPVERKRITFPPDVCGQGENKRMKAMIVAWLSYERKLTRQ